MKHPLILSLALICFSLFACNKSDDAAQSNATATDPANMAQPATPDNTNATNNADSEGLGHTEETMPPSDEEDVQLEDDMSQPPPADDELEVTEEDTLGETLDVPAPAAPEDITPAPAGE